MVEQLRRCRIALLAEVQSLIVRGLFTPQVLKPIRNTRGYHAAARDVLVLGFLLHQHWPRIEERTGMRYEEVVALIGLGEKTFEALGVRQRRSDDRAALRLDLTRAFTLMVHAHDELRRGIGFLVWTRARGYAEVDHLVPPLASGVGRKWERKRRARRDVGTSPDTTLERG